MHHEVSPRYPVSMLQRRHKTSRPMIAILSVLLIVTLISCISERRRVERLDVTIDDTSIPDSKSDVADIQGEVIPPVITTLSDDTRSLQFAITNDSKRVVFISDRGWPVLKSVPVGGGELVHISPVVPKFPTVYGVRQFSVVGSSKVVMLADTHGQNPTSLYATNAAGGDVVLLSGEHDVENYKATLGGGFVVYSVRNGEHYFAYRSKVATPEGKPIGERFQLAEPLSYGLTPNRQHVLHIGPGPVGARQLFASDIFTRDQVTLASSEGEVYSFLANSASTRVVFRTANAFGGDALFSVAVDGSGKTALLSGSNVDQAGTSVSVYQIAPDGNSVVFLGNPDDATRHRIYRNSIIGGSLTALSPDSDQLTIESALIRITPDSARVVYAALSGDKLQLYVVPSSGGEAIQLLPADSNLVLPTTEPSLIVSKTHAIFTASSTGALLYSVPLAGGALVKLADDAVVNTSQPLVLSADESQVYFLRRADIGAVQVVSVPTSGGAMRLISQNRTVELDAQRFLLSPDERNLVFAGDLKVFGRIDLLSAAFQ